MATVDQALAWAARGMRVFPLHPGRKRPVERGWTETATTDPQVIRSIWNGPDYNIGVLTNDMIVVDVDVKKGKQGLKSFMALDLPLDTLVVRTPTGGLHVYYDGPSSSLSVGALGDGLDIRSFHGYVIAPGSWLDPGHPANEGVGGHYLLETDATKAAAPQELLDRVTAPKSRTPGELTHLDESPEAVSQGEQYLLQEAPLAVEGAGGDLLTYQVAARLKDRGLSEDATFELMLEHWNERCSPPWISDELRQKVSNAYDYGTSPPGVSHPAVEFAGVSLPAPVVDRPSAPAGRRWIHPDDPGDTGVPWLFHNTLPQIGVAVLSALSGAGKTFLAIALAQSLGHGLGFFDVEPEFKGATILLAGEGASSFGPRTKALGVDLAALPIAMTQVSALAANGALAELQTDLRAKAKEMLQRHGVPVRLIILDTLSASGLLADEDDNAGAADAIKALSVISQDLNALVLVLHHPPKSGVGERGAGAIRNNSDCVLTVEWTRGSPVRDLILTKARDAEERTLGSFTLLPVTLGQDAKGRDVVSCTVSMGEGRGNIRREPQQLKAFMQALEMALGDPSEVEGDRVRIEVVKAYFKDTSTTADASNRLKAFDKSLAWAEDGGAVEQTIDGKAKYLSMKGYEQ